MVCESLYVRVSEQLMHDFMISNTEVKFLYYSASIQFMPYILILSVFVVFDFMFYGRGTGRYK